MVRPTRYMTRLAVDAIISVSDGVHNLYVIDRHKKLLLWQPLSGVLDFQLREFSTLFCVNHLEILFLATSAWLVRATTHAYMRGTDVLGKIFHIRAGLCSVVFLKIVLNVRCFAVVLVGVE